MSLSNNFSLLEISIALAFGLAYVLYILKTYLSAKKLGLGFRHILVKLFIRIAFLALVILSLLGPSFGDIKKEVKSVGKDVYFLLDLSKSMLANDLAPNRVTRAKQEIRKIANSLSGDRLGLIIFSSSAFMQCPVTHDKSAFFTFLDAADVEKMPSGGTEFFMPLDMVLEKFDKDNEASQKSRIVVLVSDGEDFNSETFDLV
ncbi:MAG: VWA domain-containing protein, partial [Cytophagales bacterium]